MRQLEFRITGLSGGNLRRWKRNKRTSSTSAAPVRAAVWVTAAVAVIYTVYYAGPIRITWPPSGTSTAKKDIEVKGTVQDTRIKNITLIVNQSPQTCQVENGAFSCSVVLIDGQNTVQAALGLVGANLTETSTNGGPGQAKEFVGALGSRLTGPSNVIRVTWEAAREVAQRAGVSPSQAIQAVELARRTNANGVLVLDEAVDKAKAIKTAAEEKDSRRAANVTGIEFAGVGPTTKAVVTPALSGITVQCTVSGNDHYYGSGSCLTDSSGSVCFNIPKPKCRDVIDTISVSVLLNGTTKSTKYAWTTGGEKSTLQGCSVDSGPKGDLPCCGN